MTENDTQNIGKNVENNTQDNPLETPLKTPKKRGKPVGLEVHPEQHPNSLCWNCKKALANPENTCCWAAKFKPVKGWKTIPGTKLSNGEERGLIVLECPEFDRWQEFTEWVEVLDEVAKEFKIHVSKVRGAPGYWLKKYEKETGKKLPKWAMMRATEIMMAWEEREKLRQQNG